jgi:monovalent cation/hydrogen antiporter
VNGVQLLIVLVGAVAVTAAARRWGRQPPLLVVAVGFAASFLPGVPRFEIEPDLILSVVVPPLLYSTAMTFSVPSFRKSLRPIITLGVWLVAVLTAVMTPISSALIVGLPAASALVLAAVIAPPDAVTAVSVGRALGLPRRLMSVLTGESLINDAMALTLFTFAVAAATGEHTFLGGNIALLFGYGVVVGIAVGLLIAFLVQLARQHLNDAPIETVIGLLVPFAAYLAAEELHASGVVAVVAAGFYLGHRSTGTGYATRLQERSVLESLDTLLEALVFAYMGLQLRFVLVDLRDSDLSVGSFLGSALLVMVIAMAVRVVFVFGVEGWRRVLRLLRRRVRRRVAPSRQRGDPYTMPWKDTTVVSWSGMRGVVTVAAAAGVPAGVTGRVQIQAVAFVVAVGTLLIQGATLPALIRRLDVGDPAEAERDAEQRTRAALIGRQASMELLTELAADPDGPAKEPGIAAFLSRMRLSGRAQQAAEEGSPPTATPDTPGAGGPFGRGRSAPSPDTLAAVGRIRADMLRAQRTALVAERDAGRLDDEIMREVLEQLDLEQAAAESRWSGVAGQ